MYVSRMFSGFQKWLFWQGLQVTEKVPGYKITDIFWQRWLANTRTTPRIERKSALSFQNVYEWWWRFRKSQWVPCELNERDVETEKHLWAHTKQKKIVFALNRYWPCKVGFQAEKVMNTQRCTLHLDRRTESLRQEDDALCFPKSQKTGIFVSKCSKSRHNLQGAWKGIAR